MIIDKQYWKRQACCDDCILHYGDDALRTNQSGCRGHESLRPCPASQAESGRNDSWPLHLV